MKRKPLLQPLEDCQHCKGTGIVQARVVMVVPDVVVDGKLVEVGREPTFEREPARLCDCCMIGETPDEG